MMGRKRIVVIGSGLASFREYALSAVASRADIVLVSKTPASWEGAYCVQHLIADLDDAAAVWAVLDGVSADAVLTYDERYIELTARLVERYQAIGPSPAAVHAVKDKSVLRALLRDAELGSVQFGVAASEQEAHRVVAELGLPVVFKPLALGGSAGVRLVTEADQIAGAFADAIGARIGTLASRYDGVLIEEYLDGPEFSVDCVTFQGVTTALVVAEKETGLEPYFEEIGHLVPAGAGLVTAEALELVRQAHRIAGLDNLVSHTELRMTPAGPRIIELNARLGGDLIPYLGLLALDVDLAGAAADIALGIAPNIQPRDLGAAAVRFCYPEVDLRVHSVCLPEPAESYPGLAVFEPLASDGVEVRLPPRGYLSRLAALVVRGADRAECQQRVAAYAAAVTVEAEPLSADRQS